MKASVLVVDDDADLAALATLVLENEGYAVTTAANGKEALERVAERMPDLILLDMKMPVMDGWRFAAELRAHWARAAPIVVLTAAPNAAKRAAEIGANGYVAKPFDIDRLLDVIESQLGFDPESGSSS